MYQNETTKEYKGWILDNSDLKFSKEFKIDKKEKGLKYHEMFYPYEIIYNDIE